MSEFIEPPQNPEDELEQVYVKQPACADACPYLLELSRPMEDNAAVAGDMTEYLSMGGLGIHYLARRWRARNCPGPLEHNDDQTICTIASRSYSSKGHISLKPHNRAPIANDLRIIYASLWAECYEKQWDVMRKNVITKIVSVLRGEVTEDDLELARTAMHARLYGQMPSKRTHSDVPPSERKKQFQQWQRDDAMRHTALFWDAYTRYLDAGELSQEEIFDAIVADNEALVERFAENTFLYRLDQRKH